MSAKRADPFLMKRLSSFWRESNCSQRDSISWISDKRSIFEAAFESLDANEALVKKSRNICSLISL